MFSCCFWWFLLGALLGWLLNWLLCRLFNCCSKKTDNTVATATPVAAAPIKASVEPVAASIKSAVEPVAAAPIKAAVEPAAVAPIKPAVEPVVATVQPTVQPVAASQSTPATAPVVAAYVLDKTAASAAGFKLRGPDDLTVIEGIGPKINGLFNTAGFYTFAQVSKMTLAQMQKILDDAGPRFRLARPDTWAKQADLANNNKWAELKTLQDHLKHGV
jgi:predicted flap endonuclease-1-like 5' DNA nuclease